MLFTLAIIPTIFVMVYIYKKDTREKESGRILFKCFWWGVVIIAPVILLENVLEAIFEASYVEGSVGYAILDGFLVAAFSEELFKYLALKFKTWKSQEFNCTFDGIIYAVFVSLGFATFENILYVLDGDLSTAVMRMFTAVPGHAYDAVFMGYFYSKAKQAEIEGNRPAMRRNKFCTLLVPILFHGIYDCLISFDEEVVGSGVTTFGFLLWIVVVIVEFVLSLKLVKKASKNDKFMVVPVTVNEM